MNKASISLFIWAILLILAQVLVFNRICLFGVAVPFVFLYILIKLPITLSREWMFTIGFAVGMIIDKVEMKDIQEFEIPEINLSKLNISSEHYEAIRKVVNELDRQGIYVKVNER